MTETPSAVVYGIYPIHGFAVLDDDSAGDLAAEIEKVQACKTVGELRSVARTLRLIAPPVDPDDLADEPSDAEWDWRTCDAVQDGDWPPMPTAQILRWASDELLDDLGRQAGARLVATTFNDDYVEITEDREAELVRVLDAHRIKHRRDDRLIETIGAWR